MATETRSLERWAAASKSDPRIARTRWVTGLREASFIAAAALLYSLVRGLTDDRVEAAFANSERVISFERSVGVFVEADLQRAIVDNGLVVDVVNAIYIAYWPIVVGVFGWLLVRHGAVYSLYRNALLASGALSLAVFATFPLAPPRFLRSRVRRHDRSGVDRLP